jgi:putative acetyltransferase
VTGGLAIRLADLDDPAVVALVTRHVQLGRANTAAGSAHALDLSGLQKPDLRLWAVWRGAALLGIGGLRRLDAALGEVKSMHTDQTQRRSGVGSARLGHIIAAARADGLRRLSLETGSWDYFAPARSFYAGHGFMPCPPFGDYREDPNSVFMTLELG